jgi:hypothetical protein
MNTDLFAWCTRRRIVFTRTRPYRKNDNCYVEQKNGAVVRQAVGYLRYDTDAELAVLTELYTHLRLYVNFFQPQMHLVSKTRQGAKVHRRYDRAQTPHQRLMGWPELPQETKAALEATYRSVNPVALKRDIARCQDRLLELSRLKEERRRKEVRTSPDHPWRTFVVRQPARSSRTS